ncbi:MAG: S41 family peptidase [Acidobacteriota bacterium]
MTSRGRLLVLLLSAPILAFALVGGVMGRTVAQGGESYRHLRIFEDVVTLILNNYVEDVDVERIMHGAMHGLADGLDPDSAYLDAEQIKAFEAGAPMPGGVGLELTRQYYLRVIAARDGSPAARAGIRPGDYVRAIDGRSTRDTSVFEGMRLLAGKPGTSVRVTLLRGNAAEPHDVELVREPVAPVKTRGRLAAPGTGYVRVAEFTRATAGELSAETAALVKAGAARLVIDLRGTAFGDLDAALAAARLFVPKGTLAFRQERGAARQAIDAAAADGKITLPLALLIDGGTSGPAELFGAALAGNGRAALIGERTLGRAARQKLVRLPNGHGLLLTHLLYLAPSGDAISEKGLTPDVAVEQPDVDFGQPLPPGDPTLDRAVEHLANAAKAAA